MSKRINVRLPDARRTRMSVVSGTTRVFPTGERRACMAVDDEGTFWWTKRRKGQNTYTAISKAR